MSRSSIAVISDVHGNRWALQAVLEDIRRRGCRRVVNLGDCAYGPLAPAATMDLLMSLRATTVRGNEDRLITDGGGGTDPAFTRHVRDSLRQEHLDWLAGLPMTALEYEDVFLCHGSPDHDDEYLLQEVTASGVTLRTTSRIAASLSSVNRALILCGHDHVPRTVSLDDGRQVVNPGSVGLPAFEDDAPFPHAMQNGSPHARYAIVRKKGTHWRAEHVAVVYDWESAASVAEKNGRPDWARWLRSGSAGSG